MTTPSDQSRRQRRAAARPSDPRIAIPHSSWSRVDTVRVGNTPIAPDDFWARLGL